MKRIAVIVDLDGTLFPGNIWEALAKHYLKHPKGFLFLVKFYVTHFHLRILHPTCKLKVLSKDGRIKTIVKEVHQNDKPIRTPQRARGD